MLKFLRKKHNQKRIYIILAITIIPPFLFWGVITSQKDSKVPSTVGVIDNRKISLREYLNSYKAVQHEMAFMYGDKLKEAAAMINFKGEAWDRLLLLHYAKKQNIKTTDNEVVDWISQQPVFQSHGQFDTNVYKLYVTRYLRSNERDFEEEIRDILTIEKVSDQVRSNVDLKDSDLKNLYIDENAERDIVYGVVSWESEKENVKVDDNDVKNIYPIVKDKLTEPEKVKISYLFVPKEKIDASKSILDEKDLPMGSLASKYSLNIKETGYFSKNDAVPDIGLSPEVLFASFSLPVDQESDWIRVDNGAYKIKVTDKKSERPLSLDEAKDSLKKIILKQKAIDAAVAKLNDLKKKMTGNDLEKFLKDNSIEAKHADKFKKGSYLPGVGPSQTVDETIIKLKEGEVSSAFATPDGAGILKIVKNWAIDEKKFEQEKEEFRKKMTAQKAQKQMKELIEKLRNQLKIDMDTMQKIFAEEKPAV